MSQIGPIQICIPIRFQPIYTFINCFKLQIQIAIKMTGFCETINFK